MTEPQSALPTPAELAVCRQILAALTRVPLHHLPDDPDFIEIVRLAARLVRNHARALRQEERRRDEELLDSTALRTDQAQTPGNVSAIPTSEDLPAILNRPRRCYVCKQPYDQVHSFYDSLCLKCGDFNLARRRQTADLTGRIALITGGRVKIGYQVVLKLLRAGATVIVTTRFPHAAACRFAGEPDAGNWTNRLVVYGLDLRLLPAVETFASVLAASQPHLDIFIHNAAQTVRRPPGFYRHLLAREHSNPADLPPLAHRLLGCPLSLPALEQSSPATEATLVPALAGWSWADLSQVSLLPEDNIADSSAFPPGVLDADGQQVDLRSRNSWGLEIQDISLIELLEVQAVNSLAPFVLLRRLEPLLRLDHHAIAMSCWSRPWKASSRWTAK